VQDASKSYIKCMYLSFIGFFLIKHTKTTTNIFIKNKNIAYTESNEILQAIEKCVFCSLWFQD